MLEKIYNSLMSHDINKTSPILLGVSGGPDSMTMLHTLKDLGYQLIIAHFNHTLRDNSDLDVIEVEKIAMELGIKYFASVGKTKTYAKENKLSVEESARKLRYSFLFKIAEQENAQAVAVGHNAEDQAETILMHILRGSGLKGLGGMQFLSMSNWSSQIPLIRPLLNVWPKEISNYCENNKLEVLVDPTNSDTKYLRNKIRLELFPILKEYNPRIQENLIQLGSMASEDYLVIDDQVKREWDKCGKIIGDHCVSLSTDEFLEQSLSMKRLLFRKAISHLKTGLNNISFGDIERAISFVSEPSVSKRIDLASNLKMEIIQKEVIIYDQGYKINLSNNPQFNGNAIELKIPGFTKLNSTWRLESKIIEYSDELFNVVKNNKENNIAYLDAEKIGDTAIVRSYQEGDKFQALGMNGKSIKLSDFFINQKISHFDRDNWPIICTKDNIIIWVIGLRISEQFKITEKTKKILLLRGF